MEVGDDGCRVLSRRQGPIYAIASMMQMRVAELSAT